MDFQTIIVTVVLTLILENLVRLAVPRLLKRVRGGSLGELNIALGDVARAMARCDDVFRKLESRKTNLDAESSKLKSHMEHVKRERDRLVGRLRDLG